MNSQARAVVPVGMNLTDAQWEFIEPLFLEKRRADGRGRPWRNAREVLNGVLWVLRTGAPWKDLLARYPPYPTIVIQEKEVVLDERHEGTRSPRD